MEGTDETHSRKERGSAGESREKSRNEAGDLISRERFRREFVNRVVSQRMSLASCAASPPLEPVENIGPR